MMGTYKFMMGTYKFMMGTYKFMMGTYKFMMGTYKFMMGTYKFMMGTYKFMMGTYKMQVMHKFVLVLTYRPKAVQQKYFSASSLNFATLSIRRIRGKGAGLLQAYKLGVCAKYCKS
jgi:hypothetical protein